MLTQNEYDERDAGWHTTLKSLMEDKKPVDRHTPTVSKTNQRVEKVPSVLPGTGV